MKIIKQVLKSVVELESRRLLPSIIKIQAWFRGCIARKAYPHLRLQHASKRNPLLISPKRNSSQRNLFSPVKHKPCRLKDPQSIAAVKIQSLWRGFITRSVVQDWILRNKSALKIQKVYRGHKSRKDLKENDTHQWIKRLLKSQLEFEKETDRKVNHLHAIIKEQGKFIKQQTLVFSEILKELKRGGGSNGAGRSRSESPKRA
jgi:replicative superfamily II helicase